MKRLAIITTHPIQYYAPVFALLTARNKIAIKVFYTLGNAAAGKHDPGFNKDVSWDIPLLNGYEYEWVENTSSNPGSHHFKGIVNPTLNKAIEQFRPDAVLIFGWSYRSHLEAMRHFKGNIPVYFRGDSTLLDKLPWHRNFVRYFMLNRVYRLVDYAFYVGLNNKAYLRKFGLKDHQLRFAPHAVDNDRFALDRQKEAAELRNRIGVTPGELLLLFAGKFTDKKSPLLLLEVFMRLRKPGIHLLFTGNGHLEKMMKVTAGESTRVHFMDFQNQSYMPVVYHACDIFCLPSKGPGETWGLAINEAMACSKPVVVSDKVGCAMDLVSAKNGAVFPAADDNALYQVLDKLLEDNERLKEMGKNSSAIIAPWNFTNIAGAIENQLLNEAN